MATKKTEFSDLASDLQIKVLRHCSEPTRDNAGKTSRHMKVATDIARRTDYKELANRLGRWTLEPLPTAIELANRGCLRPNWTHVAKVMQVAPSEHNGSLGRFYLHAAALIDSERKRYEASWQTDLLLLQYIGGESSGTPGEPHGFGVYNTKGERYEGEFETGIRNGYGFARYANGSCYEGNWKSGLPHGRGAILSSDGTRYEGIWRSPDRPGIFHQITSRGSDGLIQLEEAYLSTHDGTRHDLDWEVDERGKRKAAILPEHGFLQCGFGTISYPDGSRYEGAWMWGKPHGRGLLTHPDGNCDSGVWALGILQ